MGIFQSLVTVQIIFILGIFNLVAAVLIFFSCRCLPGSRWAGGLMKYSAYKRFYKYHCYIWWVLLVSVVIHAGLAFAFFGSPFK
jgi:hypothetical protein